MATAAEEYGYHMGLAFQIVDDILDIVGAADVSSFRMFALLVPSINSSMFRDKGAHKKEKTEAHS